MGISKQQLKDAMSYVTRSLLKLTNKVDSINIAQKTVNQRGIKELLNKEITFAMGIATTNGTAKETLIDQTIDLSSGIEDYDFLQIYARVNSTTRRFKYNATTLDLPVVYNNSNVNNLQDGSSMYIIFSQGATAVGSFGAFHFVLLGWFKSPTQFYIRSITNPLTNTDYNAFSISSIKGVKLDSVTIDPVNYINTTNGIEDGSVGSILFLIGKTAPKHYITMDGAVLNIADYPYLAQHFYEQFGKSNQFGGDGVTTFRIPDGRDEFIRGYHNNKTDKKSGEIGVHQDATNHLWFENYTNGILQTHPISATEPVTGSSNYDSRTTSSYYNNYKAQSFNPEGQKTSTYTSRPTNIAALWCIKYEPTYFMNIQGLIQESILWQGETIFPGAGKEQKSQIILNESFDAFDKIGIFVTVYYKGVTTGMKYLYYHEVPVENLKILINDVNKIVSFAWGYNDGQHIDYVNMWNDGNMDLKKFAFVTYNCIITKIIGIKYKTSQGGGGNCDCPTYTDEEIRESLEEIYNGS